MNINECYYLGYTSKVHGKSGEVIIQPDVDDPNEYINLESMLIQLNKKDSALIPFFIEGVQVLNNGTLRVKIEDVNSIEEAKPYIGKEVYLPLNTLPELSGKEFYFHEVKGFDVIDLNYGEVGKVQKVMEHPKQAILEIVNSDGKEILVPINDDIIQEIDRSKGLLKILTPEGLIELYL